MDVVCNVKDCAYCGASGFCLQQYVFLVNGTCKWLINNPNYRTPAPVDYEMPKELVGKKD